MSPQGQHLLVLLFLQGHLVSIGNIRTTHTHTRLLSEWDGTYIPPIIIIDLTPTETREKFIDLIVNNQTRMSLIVPKIWIVGFTHFWVQVCPQNGDTHSDRHTVL